MPIDKKIFNFAKDPSPSILKFLIENPENAFTAGEIYDAIKQFEELGIPLQKIKDTLDFLVKYNRIEVAWLKGDTYYSIKLKPKLA